MSEAQPPLLALAPPAPMDTTPDRISARPKGPTVVQARIAVAAEFLVLGAFAGVWAAHLPVVPERLHLDPATIGLVLLCMASGAVFTMPLTGALLFQVWLAPADGGARYHLYSVLGALTVLSPTLPLLFVSAIFMGACMGGLDVAMNTQASEVEVARGKPTMSSFHGFFSLGALGGAAGGGALIGLGYSNGLGAAMIAVVLFAVAIAAAFYLWHGEPSTTAARISACRRAPSSASASSAFWGSRVKARSPTGARCSWPR